MTPDPYAWQRRNALVNAAGWTLLVLSGTRAFIIWMSCACKASDRDAAGTHVVNDDGLIRQNVFVLHVGLDSLGGGIEFEVKG